MVANKKRLIYADDLLEKVQFRLPIDNHNAEVIAGCVDITRRLIENAPTVDAVEVTRCGKCLKGDPSGFPKGRVWCSIMCRYMKEDAFCSEGERRNDEKIY